MLIKSSGKKGASALIFKGPCNLIGISFTGDTAQEPTLTVYDNTSATGTEVAFLMVSDETHTINIMFPDRGLFCSTGLYAAISAETGDYIIYYSI